MGSVFSNIFKPLFGKREVRILTVGLDASGKTTMIYKFKLGEIVTTIPTIGFNVESVEYKNISFTVWDVGGRDGTRRLIHHYYQNTQAVILCVDTSDIQRLPEAADELRKLNREPLLKNIPFLIFANKRDLKNACTMKHFNNVMDIKNITDRQYQSCFTSGDGMYEGLDWLSKVVTDQVATSTPASTTPTTPSVAGAGQNATKEEPGFFSRLFGLSKSTPDAAVVNAN